MPLLKDQKQIYVDNIKDQLEGIENYNIDNCPTTDMKGYLQPDGFSFKYSDIDTIIKNVKYRKGVIENGFSDNMEFINIPWCNMQRDGIDDSGCCVSIGLPEITDACSNPISKCEEGKSTGFAYTFRDTKVEICHAQQIQNKTSDVLHAYENLQGIGGFFKLLLILLIILLFYTLLSLPYEFWLRYGNSIQCIYYKVHPRCNNMGPKNSEQNNGKLTLIQYAFPDNLHNYPYEACNSGEKTTSGGNKNMKGGRETEGTINSNYIEYNDNGSKCINVDFDDDEDEIRKRRFPYNIGEYANNMIINKRSKYIAILLKGFSFYYLYTILLFRYIFNKSFSWLSKFYQKKHSTNPTSISTGFFLFSLFFGLPFAFFGIIIPIVILISSLLPIYITLMDVFKDLNFFGKDVKTSPSVVGTGSLAENPTYYKIYEFFSLFYRVFPKKNHEGDESNFDKDYKFTALTSGLSIGIIVSLIIVGIDRNDDSRVSDGSKLAMLISIIAFPAFIYFCALFFTKTLQGSTSAQQYIKFMNGIKRGIANLFLFFIVIFLFIFTFAVGSLGSLMAAIDFLFGTFFKIYYIALSNSIELLDLFKNHSRLLIILLLVIVIASSRKTLPSATTGIMGGLLGLYLLYQLYKFT